MKSCKSIVKSAGNERHNRIDKLNGHFFNKICAIIRQLFNLLTSTVLQHLYLSVASSTLHTFAQEKPLIIIEWNYENWSNSNFESSQPTAKTIKVNEKCRYQSKEIVIEFFNALLENRIENPNQRHPPTILDPFHSIGVIFQCFCCFSWSQGEGKGIEVDCNNVVWIEPFPTPPTQFLHNPLNKFLWFCSNFPHLNARWKLYSYFR